MRVTYQSTMQAWSRNEHLSPITVTQDDALSRYLQITIIDMSGLPVNLSGAVVNVHFSKADKTVVYSAATVLNATGGQIEVALTTQVTAIAKSVTVTVQVVSADGPTLFVRGLLLDVQPCNVTGSVESSNEFTALTDAIATVGGLDGRISNVEDTEISGHRIGDGNFDLSTDDMKSGTLPVARGGTGKSSWTANRLIYPSASTILTQMPAPTEANSFLLQGTSGAPVWKSPTDALSIINNWKSTTYTENGFTVNLARAGNCVQLQLTAQMNQIPVIAAWGSYAIATLPSGWRPALEVVQRTTHAGGNSEWTKNVWTELFESGRMQIRLVQDNASLNWTGLTSGHAFKISMTYLTANPFPA